MGYGIEGALKFGFYEFFKPVFGNLTPNAFLNFLLASVVAGAVASVVLCPCEDARIRMVSEPHFATGLVDALVKLIKEDGFLATFDGLAAMLMKQVPYTMTKQVNKFTLRFEVLNFFQFCNTRSVDFASSEGLISYA